MELQTVGQVSKLFNISIRTLHYYEQIGLINPTKNDDNAYRLYDEGILIRLRQIVVLRKLRIPLKQISEILKNGEARVAIEAFERKLSEIDFEITALSTIRDVISAFIKRLNINDNGFALSEDEGLFEIIDSLTISKINFKEEVTMDELNKATEDLAKSKERNVRVVYLPPMTFAVAYAVSENPHEASKLIMKKFISDEGLYKIKPDFRTFGWGNTRDGRWVYDVMVSIPPELEVPAPLIKTNFVGGLYATYTSNPPDFGDMHNVLENWAQNSDEFERRNDATPLEEAINPLTMTGKKNIYEETTQFMYFDFHLPIKQR